MKNQVQMIRVDESIGNNWFHFFYADKFSLSQWIADQPNPDYKRSLKIIMDKTSCPLIFSEEKKELDVFDSSSFNLVADNTAAPTIGAAFILDIPIISFLSKPHWKEDSICIRHEYLDPQTSDILEEVLHVENVSELTHLPIFFERIKKERQASKTYLKALQESGNDDYANLIFCTNVLDDFKQLGATTKLLNKIKDVLEGLNKSIETATSVHEIKEILAFNITGESDNTKNNPRLIKHRKFKLPDGTFYTFDLHVKNFPDGHRLYFYPDFQQKRIYIGYFGPHLPI